MADLPMDILFHHILPRLPAKSVIRLMTVSKEFHTFINTQKFAKLHLHHHQNHDKLLVYSATKPLFSTINCEALDNDLAPPNRRVSFLAGYVPYMTILTSLHGMVCVGIHDHTLWSRYSDLVLWNPLTGDYKILSKINFGNPSLHAFKLFYSSHDDDYRLVHVTTVLEVYIYSLKSDSWRKVADSTSKLAQIGTCKRVWLNDGFCLLKDHPLSIIRFDVKAEKLTEITEFLPPLQYRVKCVFLVVHEGCIHFCVRYLPTEGGYETWRMNEDGDWSNVDTYKVLQVHVLSLEKNVTELRILKKYDQLRIFGGEPFRRYTETLVSPNQYMNK